MMKTVKHIFFSLLLFLLPGILSAGSGYCYGIPKAALFYHTVLLCTASLSLAFAWLHCDTDGSLDYENGRFPGRFALFFLGGMAVSCLMPFFPHTVWPLIPFAVALSLFSNLFLGFFAYGIVIMNAVFQTESSEIVFFLYFICGGAAALLLRRLEKTGRSGIPVTIALLYLFMAQTALAVLYGETPVTAEIVALPAINVFVTGLLLVLLLRYFSFRIGSGHENEQVVQDVPFGQEEREEADEPDEETELMAEMERRQKRAEEEDGRTYATEPALQEEGNRERRDVLIRELSVTDGRSEERKRGMSFYLENETETDFPFILEEVVEAVTKEILTGEACPYEAHVNVLLTDNEGIRRYNRDFRGMDRPTDVLSFPNLDFERPSDFSVAEKNKAACFDMDSGELMLGDIVVSVDRIKEQAEAYGHSEKREFAFLVAHSMLHLCGYDHMEEGEAAVMKQKQITALRNVGITRDYK